MAGRKSKAAHWSPLISSTKVRLAVEHRLKQKCWNLKRLSEESGIDMPRLSRYINGKPQGITHIQLYQILEILGIRIRFEIEFNYDEN